MYSMHSSSIQYRIGPECTPKVIRFLVITTCAVSIVSALLDPLFLYVFHLSSPQELLSLSRNTLQRFFLWQPLTYLFIHGIAGAGITFGLLISLALNMFMLWIFGSTVLERVGTKPFLRFYLFSGVFAGITTLLTLTQLGSYAVIYGSSPCIFALFVVWVMLNPQAELLLFFIFPVKAKWLLAGTVGAILLVNLSQLNLIGFTHTLSALLFAYGYGLLAWDLRSPYPTAHRFEDKIATIGKQWRQQQTSYANAKIIDFKTGRSIVDEDELFMDNMLEKIGRQGEKSLSWRERRRMDKIAKRQNN